MQPFSDTRIFAGYRLNTDSADEVLQPNEVRQSRNMIEELFSGRIVNLKGFDNLMSMAVNSGFSLPSGTLKQVGFGYDIENGAILYALCDTTGTNHSILHMTVATRQLQWVLKAESYLNFQPYYRVRMKVLNGTLYFTDGYEDEAFVDYNPPRKLNIDKAIAFTEEYYNGTCAKFDAIAEAQTVIGSVSLAGKTAYRLTTSNPFATGTMVVSFVREGTIPGIRYKEAGGYAEVLGNYGGWLVLDITWLGGSQQSKTGHVMLYSDDRYHGIDWEVLDLIVYQPSYKPTVAYATDSTMTVNKLRDNIYQFAYRYRRKDNSRSVFSPISDIPYPAVPAKLTGTYDYDNIHDNVIAVTVNSGHIDVSEIEIIVRSGNTGAWSIIHREFKYDREGALLLAPDIQYTYLFTGNELTESIDQGDTARPFDSIPHIASTLELIEKNRLLLADYTESFDNIDIDIELSLQQTPIDLFSGQPHFNFIPGSSNAPSYARGIKWNLGTYYGNPPPAGKYISPSSYSCVVCDFANIPLRPGNEYSFQVSAPFYVYTAPSPGNMPYPTVNQYDSVVGFATVVLEESDTIQSLLNKFCDILRNHQPENTSVIAFVRNAWAPYNHHLWGEWTVQGGIPPDPFDHLLKDTEIGFVLQLGGAGGVDFTKITITLDITPALTRSLTFKSGTYQTFGSCYFDRAGRYGPVNISDDCTMYIPAQTEVTPTHYLLQNTIRWEINHKPPIWATGYQFCYMKNRSISYFVWCPVVNIAKRFVVNEFVGSFLAIGVLENFAKTKEDFGKFNVAPYVWQSGDRVRFVLKGETAGNEQYFKTFSDVLDFEIIQYEDPSDTGAGETYKKNDIGEYVLDNGGNKIKDPNFKKLLIPFFPYTQYGIDADDLAGQSVIIEIYRPAKNTDNAVYYFFGPRYKIINPHTDDRQHAGDTFDGSWGRDQTDTYSAQGTFIGGDAYMYSRFMENEEFSQIFPCESPFYSDWFNSESISIGLPNAENRYSKRQRYESNVRFGGKLVQDTLINDIPTFSASDFMALPIKYGAISGLAEVGASLKIIQAAKSSSMYIGRAGLTQPSENAQQIITSTKDVLGTIEQQTSDFGTVHTGSLQKFEGKLYFFDFYANAICRDAGNGIQDISEAYKIKTTIRTYCALWGTPDNVDVVSGVDQENSLVIWTFIDKTTVANSLTISFRDTGGRNQDGFVGPFDFIPTDYGMAKNTLTSWKNNSLWLHNSETADRSTFYGVRYPYSVTVVFNKMWSDVKRFLQVFISSAKKFSSPNAGDISIPATDNDPVGMVSLLKSGAFRSVQGKFVADFGKNMTTHQSTAQIVDLVNGDDLQGQSMSMRLEGSETEEHSLLSVEVQGITSKI